MTKEGELILVYVNSNKNGKKWYECYLIYDHTYFEAEKKYLLSCKSVKSDEYTCLTNLLSKKFDNLRIINRLPLF